MQDTRLNFSAAQRLKTPKQFQAVYQSKQWGGSAHFTYNVLATDIETAVLGVTVSKKVSKAAVHRNRIKRQMKEFYRLRQHQLTGAHVVITAKPSSLKATDEQRQASLTELWDKLMRWQRWQRKQQAKQPSSKSP
ncbi:ribonuclease P protein component [Arenicella xantha]|uniref:Ribonuclease P protein component n=1 Tax=Arenicella xantha TaxID=644221 RepID=A0A395JQ36_9GAMM|nr:ribonuclease P protein component [Arenicella xantha]RBP53761.1 ribonuclease P protein component [Arenicella xantha]